MNCCDAWGRCTRGTNCPARHEWTFPKERIPPETKANNELFFYIGFVLFVAIICGVAGLVYGLLWRFAPDMLNMIIYLFS